MSDSDTDPKGAPTTETSESPSIKKVKFRLRPVKSKVAVPVKQKREQSTVGFPYNDLESAIVIAQAMLGAGGGALSREQLAGVTGLSVGSGNFVLRVAAARLFGLVANVQGKYELTPLGFEVIGSDEKMRRAARAKAFLNVPLYQKVYSEFRGRQLPPRPHGLEQAFVRYGVAPKQRTNARLAFDKSAKQAGFFDNGNDRLVEPIIAAPAAIDRSRPPVETLEEEAGTGRAGRILDKVHAEGRRRLHPFVQGLLDSLPEPETTWAIEGRAKWLQAAATMFDLMYKGDGTITIVMQKIPDAALDQIP